MIGRYSKYIPTNNNWIEELPVGWVLSKFGFVKTILTDYTANGSFADLKKNVEYKDEPEFARLIRLTDLRKDLKNENGVWVDEKAYNYLAKSALFGGEFLLANVGAHAGLFYQMPFNAGPATLAPNMFMAKFDEKIVCREFMAYVGESQNVNCQLRLLATSSSAQPKLNKDDFKSVVFAYPPLTVQTVIVKYLQNTLSKIDNLIGEKESFIQLLQEKRQALISHVVTKGLDDSVKMKHSGVEWIGDIPEHWEVKKLKHCIDAIESGTSVNSESYQASSDEIAVLKTSCVYTGEFRPQENKVVVQEELIRVTCPVKSDRLIVSRMNTPDLVGAAGYTNCEYPNLFLPDRLWQISFTDKVNTKFIYYFTQSNIYRDQIKVVCVGTSSSMQNLSQDDFKNFCLSIPDKPSQQKIVEAIELSSSKIQTIISETIKSIDLLKEHRTALISAAVTGKIDVREAV